MMRLLGLFQQAGPFHETPSPTLDTFATSDVQVSYFLVSQIIVLFTYHLYRFMTHPQPHMARLRDPGIASEVTPYQEVQSYSWTRVRGIRRG
jgi:hypothetical protein